MNKKDFRDLSRLEFIVQEGRPPSIEQLTLGAVQRIADATELMAKEYNSLMAQLDWYKERYKRQTTEINNLKNQLKAQKSAKSRVKNKLESLKNNIKDDHND